MTASPRDFAGGAGANGALFALATAIWGSTWLAIKFQLGSVEPLVSVAYRFAIASVLLMAWCRMTRQPLMFRAGSHRWLAAQGATFFGLNYVAVYEAERYIPSGLVAIVFSSLVFMTPIGTRLAFGTPIRPRILVGATLGVAGVVLMFTPMLGSATLSAQLGWGVALALAGTLVACIGNLVSMRLQRENLPLLPATAWGMAYGTLFVAVMALATGVPWTFDARPAYVLSLLYLAVFGSIVAFIAYLALLRRAGAVATFVAVSTPVVAMLVSTVAEGYRWTAGPLAGLLLAVVGNVIALARERGGRAARS